MRRPPAAAAAAVAALAAAGCGAAVAAPPPLAPILVSRAQAALARPYGAADTAFGLDVLGAWCRSQPRSDIVFSPASLAAGLGLAYLGARGATAAAMARVLHLPAAGGPRLEAGLRARQSALRRLGRPGVTLDGSNRVWAGSPAWFRRSYLDAVAATYGARPGRAPLSTEPATAEQVINAAIARDTRGHIPELLAPGAVTGDDWVLTDALYMDAQWAHGFSSAQTAAGPFTAASGGTVTARFMHGTGYRYATAGGWTGVDLPYRGGGLAMTALLPPAGRGSSGCRVPAAAVLGEITAEAAAGGHGPRGSRIIPAAGRAGIALPAVSLSSHQDMNELLTRLGMGIAFSAAADFTGLSPAACCISLVEHAATLQVGEKGAVGSAATAVGMTMSALEAPISRQVVFDRPYLMLVTDTVTGEPLFVARVADPGA